jgi:hypothetical protein
MASYVGKILVGAAAVVVGFALGGMLSAVFDLPQPKMPEAVDNRLLALSTFVGSVALCVGLVGIARRLRGGFWARWLIVAGFAYGCLGINNTIEAAIFTSIGGWPTLAVLWLVTCLLVTGLIAGLFRSPTRNEPLGPNVRRFFAARSTGQWVGRFFAAWLAFPAVYFLFGMPVGLLVQGAYRAEAFGLRLPSLPIIIGVQLVRSVIFLVVSLPVLVAWSDSRRRLGLTYGLSLFIVLGLYGMIQAYWLPWDMRGIHAIEILLDSLVYGWLLVILLVPSQGLHSEPLPSSAPASEGVAATSDRLASD